LLLQTVDFLALCHHLGFRRVQNRPGSGRFRVGLASALVGVGQAIRQKVGMRSQEHHRAEQDHRQARSHSRQQAD
jgi:hypothetical protein